MSVGGEFVIVYGTAANLIGVIVRLVSSVKCKRPLRTLVTSAERAKLSTATFGSKERRRRLVKLVAGPLGVASWGRSRIFVIVSVSQCGPLVQVSPLVKNEVIVPTAFARVTWRATGH